MRLAMVRPPSLPGRVSNDGRTLRAETTAGESVWAIYWTLMGPV